MGTPSMALLPTQVSEEGATLPGHAPLRLTPAQRSALTSGDVTVGVRPDGVSLAPPGQGLPSTLDVVEELGNDSYLYVTVDLASGPVTVPVRDTGNGTTIAPGTPVGLQIHAEAVHLFDTATGDRLEA